MKVFVYGSLLSGLFNHRLLEGSEFLGQGVTLEFFRLVSLGAYPACLSKGQGAPVVGEVYEVSDLTFSRLDRLEGYPNYYNRSKVGVKVGESEVKAWIYHIERDSLLCRGEKEIADGDWKKFVSSSLSART